MTDPGLFVWTCQHSNRDHTCCTQRDAEDNIHTSETLARLGPDDHVSVGDLVV
jgi:hypothetical protein